MPDSVPPASPTGAPGAAPTGPAAKKPTAWIVTTVVAVVAAVGFAVWGFSVNSDLDAANKTIKEQKAVIVTGAEQAAATEAKAVKFSEKEKARYRNARNKLGASRQTTKKLKANVAKQQAELATARQQLDNASTQSQRLKARLAVAQEQADVAQACSQSTIHALDLLFEAPTAKAGVNRVTTQLAAIQRQCNTTIS